MGALGQGMAANVLKSVPQIKNVPVKVEVGAGLSAGTVGLSSIVKTKSFSKLTTAQSPLSISKSSSKSAVKLKSEQKAVQQERTTYLSLGRTVTPTISQASARGTGLALLVSPVQASGQILRQGERQVSRSASKLRILQRTNTTAATSFKSGNIGFMGLGGLRSSANKKKAAFKFPKFKFKTTYKKRKFTAIPKPDLLSYHITAIKYKQKGKELPATLARSVFRKTSGFRVPTLQMLKGKRLRL
jgi:hypothetical protein